MSTMLAEPAEKLAAANTPRTQQTGSKKRIVIIGGGFAGIAAARALKHADAEVVLVDRRNHHIFQPLLYQAATAVLAPSEIAAPIRQLAVKQRNATVVLAEVTGIDLKSRTLMPFVRRSALERFHSTFWWSPLGCGPAISATTSLRSTRPVSRI
jgi:NADH dehydrogenase